jgi:threonine/homoserine/homoserine lactone efflux protein
LGLSKRSPARLYLRGVVMNVTNPKVSIFFLAFLPQFTNPSFGPLLPQFLVLGGLFVVSTLLVFGGVSCIAGWLGTLLRTSKRPERILNRVAGTVFLCLAIKLVLSER